MMQELALVSERHGFGNIITIHRLQEAPLIGELLVVEGVLKLR